MRSQKDRVMAFSTPAFVFAFLPVVYILHLIIRNQTARNLLLLVASLLFYSAGSLTHLTLLIGVALVNFLSGLLFRKRVRFAKTVLVVSLILNLGALALFKYLNFFGSEFSSLFGLRGTLPQIALPIGISFFTFQGISYAMDVYRNPEAGTTSFFELLLYISFFPQLIAGPIVQYHDVAEQLRRRTLHTQEMAEGFRRFVVGLSKKLLIADILAAAVDPLFAQSGSLDFRTGLLAAIGYSMQIYFDFSGYSDMAIGMGRMFGFHFLENFHHPYSASTVRDFWRRWHISLSHWFREYLYIPLGGNRKGLMRTCLNLMIVFFLTGLWHGANWTFVIWGLWHGFWCVLERLTPLKKLQNRVIGHIYTMLIVIIGFVVFRADSFAQAADVIGAVFTGFRLTREGAILLRSVLSVKLLLAGFLAVFLSTGLQRRFVDRIRGKAAWEILCNAGALVCLCLCSLRLAAASFNPFIYFRF